MTDSANVTNFHLIDQYPGYDKVNNPLRRTVAELTPLAIAWINGGVRREIQNATGIYGIPLADGMGIAVVEGPYDSATNKAYIANANGSLRATVSSIESKGQTMFYDVFYIKEGLVFLAAALDHDVQILVNERDGAILRVAEFR